jgi:hypothetical protein
MKVLPQYFQVGAEENYEILIQDNRCSDRHSNREFPNMGRIVNLIVVSLLGLSWSCPSKSSHTYKQIYIYTYVPPEHKFREVLLQQSAQLGRMETAGLRSQ